MVPYVICINSNLGFCTRLILLVGDGHSRDDHSDGRVEFRGWALSDVKLALRRDY